MTVLYHRSTGDLARDLEAYLSRERELSIWSYPHFMRYLRALIFKVTPEPHRCVRRVLAALQDGSLLNATSSHLRQLATDPPQTPGAGRVAREAANAICEIIGFQAGRVGISDMQLDDAHECYHRAVHIAKQVEREALYLGLHPDVLYECAVLANAESEIDANRRDAAMAAITAGHFRLAHEIATDKPD